MREKQAMFSLDSNIVLQLPPKGMSTVEEATALQLSAARGAEREVDFILRQDGGERVDAANKMGWTALMLAARNGHSAIVRNLVAVGANVSLTNRYGANVLSLAVASNDKPTIIAVIHAMSKNVNKIFTNSPLLVASLFGNLATVELLLGYNSDPNAASALGITPLMMAAAVGNSSITSLLLRVGANKNISNYSHQTALDIALLKNHDNIVALLTDQRHRHVFEGQALGSVARHFSPKSSTSSPIKRTLNGEPVKCVTPNKTLFIDQRHPHVFEGEALGNMATYSSPKSSMYFPSPTKTALNAQPIQTSVTSKSLFVNQSHQHASECQVLGSMPAHCSSPNSGICTPVKKTLTAQSIQISTPKKTLQKVYSPYPQKTNMHQLSPMRNSVVRTQENVTSSPPSYTSRSCSPNLSSPLPLSPLKEHGLRPFTTDTFQFVLHSPSPCRTRPELNTSSPSPRHINTTGKKMYSPLRRGCNVYRVNSENKENVSTQRGLPVDSTRMNSSWALGGESSPRRGKDRWPPANNTHDVKEGTSYKALWKCLNSLASPKRSYFSPHKDTVGASRHATSTRPLGELLTLMDLGEYAQLFHTHELEVDTFLSLNERDLEDIGVDNKTVRRSILDKISRVNRTATKWPSET